MTNGEQQQGPQCHYDVLGCAQDAETSVIKKHYRKLVLKYHPDKNLGDEQAADKFILVQRAYEVLMDPQERKWYDDHRDAILAGWSASDSTNNDTADIMLFNVAPFMHPGCYSSYHNDKGGFYQVYQNVFENIVSCETKQSETVIDLPTNFGTSDTSWSIASVFYKSWECFSSALNFAWEDTFNAREDAPSRRVRRLMEEENNKARKNAKKVYKNDILQLVAFVKKRDPRMKAHVEEQERLKKEREAKQKLDKIERKKEQQKAKEAWREASLLEMEKAEEEDRLKGRIRLADLEDDYDYGGGKKKKGKKKKKKPVIEEEEEGEKDTKNSSTNVDQKEEEEKTGCAPADGTSDDGENDDGKSTSHSTSPIDNLNPGEQTIDQEDDERRIQVPLSTNVVDDMEDEDEDSTESEERPLSTNVVDDMEDDVEEDSTETEERPLSNNVVDNMEDDVDEDSTESESEDEPDSWRCDCCRKDFKSEGQMQNHTKSKKHKEAFKKFQAKLKKREEEIMAELMEEIAMNDDQ